MNRIGAATAPRRTAALTDYALALAFASALFVSPAWRTHVDDFDSQIYLVVARHMIEDGTWLNLRDYVGEGRLWREHLPFALWPYAATIRLWGEDSLVPLASLLTLATVGLVGWVTGRLGGRGAALLAMFALGSHQAIVFYGARPRLDNLLLLFATAAVAPVLLGPPTRAKWIWAAIFGAMASLVKGPFGVLPLAAAIAARAIVDRSWSTFYRGCAALFIAVLPVVGFLLWDLWEGEGTWWTGYAAKQLMASALTTRSRTGMFISPWYPLEILYKPLWFGLPLVGLGVWRVLSLQERPTAPMPSPGEPRRPTLQLLCLLCLFIFLGLCLPVRKVAHHAWIVLPFLAVLAGVAAGHFLDKWGGTPNRRRVVNQLLLAVVLVAWLVTLVGKGPKRPGLPCPASLEFSGVLGGFLPGDRVWIIDKNPNWYLAASLAAEQRLIPLLGTELPVETLDLRRDIVPRIALVSGDRLPPSLGPWKEVGRSRGWSLLQRE